MFWQPSSTPRRRTHHQIQQHLTLTKNFNEHTIWSILLRLERLKCFLCGGNKMGNVNSVPHPTPQHTHKNPSTPKTSPPSPSSPLSPLPLLSPTFYIYSPPHLLSSNFPSSSSSSPSHLGDKRAHLISDWPDATEKQETMSCLHRFANSRTTRPGTRSPAQSSGRVTSPSIEEEMVLRVNMGEDRIVRLSRGSGGRAVPERKCLCLQHTHTSTFPVHQRRVSSSCSMF